MGNFLSPRRQDVLLLALGRSKAALACFDRLLKRPLLDCHRLVGQAHIHGSRGNFDKAVDSLRLLTRTRRQEPFGWCKLGYVLQQVGEQGKAGRAFREALAD